MDNDRACMCGHALGASAAGFTSALELPPPEPGVVDIAMKDFQFSPDTVTVTPGTTIRWTNLDDTSHDTVSQNPGLWQSQYLSPGSSFTFDVPDELLGSYFYDCTLHGGMTGQIIVTVPEPTILGGLPVSVFVLAAKRRKIA